MDYLENDLEYHEERSHSEVKPSIKKNIPLKIKSSINSSIQSSSSNKTANIINSNSSSSNIQVANTVSVSTLPIINNTHESVSTSSSSNRIPLSSNNSSAINFSANEINKTQNQTDHGSKNKVAAISNMNLVNYEFNPNNLNAISEKLVDQKMDYCMLCLQPILIYGRLIPCKHIMCMNCANAVNVCFKDKCNETIERIEIAERNRIFVCDYDQELGNSATIENYRMQPESSQKKLCGRSYMSQRDLDAHIQDRHNNNNNNNNSNNL